MAITITINPVKKHTVRRKDTNNNSKKWEVSKLVYGTENKIQLSSMYGQIAEPKVINNSVIGNSIKNIINEGFNKGYYVSNIDTNEVTNISELGNLDNTEYMEIVGLMGNTIFTENNHYLPEHIKLRNFASENNTSLRSIIRKNLKLLDELDTKSNIAWTFNKIEFELAAHEIKLMDSHGITKPFLKAIAQRFLLKTKLYDDKQYTFQVHINKGLELAIGFKVYVTECGYLVEVNNFTLFDWNN